MNDKERFVNLADLKRKSLSWFRYRQSSNQTIEDWKRLLSKLPITVQDKSEVVFESNELCNRAFELLKATEVFLTKLKLDNSDALLTTVFYDEANCDGYCLLDDIKACLDEAKIGGEQDD